MGLLGDLAGAAANSLFSAGGSRSAASLDVHQNDQHAAAHHEVGVLAAAKAHRHASFLDMAGGSSSSSAPVCHGFGRTSFAGNVMYSGPELGDVRTRLMYQSPEIYSTDISEMDKVMRKHKFAGMWSHNYAITHPEFRFKNLEKGIHVHMVDTATGEVFWDANYALSFIPGLGSRTLGSHVQPVPSDPGTVPVMRKLFIKKDDPGPHLFDISINTRDNWYEDQNDTPWGDAEGFGKLYGPNAHVGVEVYRLPKLVEERIKGKSTGRMIEKGCEVQDRGEYRGGASPILSNAAGRKKSRAPCHNDNLERIINQEEDIFASSPTDMTPDDGREYYGWIIKKNARDKDNYDYMFKPNVPALVRPFAPWKFGEGAKPDIQGIEGGKEVVPGHDTEVPKAL